MITFNKCLIILILSIFIQSCVSSYPKYIATGKKADMVIDVPFELRTTLIVWAYDEKPNFFTLHGKNLYASGVDGVENIHVKLSANKKIFLEVRYESRPKYGCIFDNITGFTPLENGIYRMKISVINKNICKVAIFDESKSDINTVLSTISEY